MSLKLKIHHIITKIKYKLLLQNIKPEILGYKDRDGKFIKGTGVSNMTHISFKENVSIGRNVHISHFCSIDGYCKVTLGNGSGLAGHVIILTHSGHNSARYHALSQNKTKDIYELGLITGEVHIGEYTFVGPNTMIMPGSKIGRGCLVSAYSYVNGEFPDYSIIRGQPARVVGSTKDMDKKFYETHPEYKQYYYNQNLFTEE